MCSCEVVICWAFFAGSEGEKSDFFGDEEKVVHTYHWNSLEGKIYCFCLSLFLVRRHIRNTLKPRFCD